MRSGQLMVGVRRSVTASVFLATIVAVVPVHAAYFIYGIDPISGDNQISTLAVNTGGVVAGGFMCFGGARTTTRGRCAA